MFGKNQIIGKKFFENSGNKIFVTSMFYTLQGEGPYRGEPAVFIRLAKCNLSCSFCDTFFDDGNWYTIDELGLKVVQELHKFFGDINGDLIPDWAENTPNNKRGVGLVLTGGEPMLQSNICHFLKLMSLTFKWTQIESNGLLWQDIPDETTLVCSPKCHEENGKAIRYLSPNKRVLERADCLKFVMEADQNSPYSSIPNWAFEWRDKYNKPIFISPMNEYLRQPKKGNNTIEERSSIDEVISWWEPGLLNLEKNEKNHKYTANFCIKNGCTFNMQLHLFAGLA